MEHAGRKLPELAGIQIRIGRYRKTIPCLPLRSAGSASSLLFTLAVLSKSAHVSRCRQVAECGMEIHQDRPTCPRLRKEVNETTSNKSAAEA
jgi:hypothetical protein